MLLVPVLVVAAAATRHEWQPALHELTVRSTAGTGPAPRTGTSCPASTSDSMPGGGGALIAEYQTSQYEITLCRSASGTIYYHGVQKDSPSQQITLPARLANGSYQSSNAGYTYLITKHDLIVTEGSQILLDQGLSPVS